MIHKLLKQLKDQGFGNQGQPPELGQGKEPFNVNLGRFANTGASYHPGAATGGLLGLTVSQNARGRRPSTDVAKLSLSDIGNWYQTPWGESDSLTLGETIGRLGDFYRKPLTESDRTDLITLDDLDFSGLGDAGVLHPLHGIGSERVREGIDPAPTMEDPPAFLEGPKELWQLMKDRETARREEWRKKEEAKRLAEQREAIGGPEEKPVKVTELSSTEPAASTDPTDPAAPTDPADRPLTYMEQLQKLMADQSASSSQALSEAATAEQKYLDYLKGQSGGDQDKWAALTQLGLNLMSEAPQYEGENLLSIAGRAGKEPLAALQASQKEDKALNYKIAEVEKDMAVRRAGLKTAADQQSFDNKIALIGAQADASAARLKLYEGLQDIDKNDLLTTGGTARTELGRLTTMDEVALSNLIHGNPNNPNDTGLGIKGLTVENFPRFVEHITARVPDGGAGSNKYRENDYMTVVAAMAKKIYAQQETPDILEANRLAIVEFIKQNDVFKTPGFRSLWMGKDALGASGT